MQIRVSACSTPKKRITQTDYQNSFNTVIAIHLKKEYLQFFLNINLTFYDLIVQSVFPGSIKNNTNIFHGIIKMKMLLL